MKKVCKKIEILNQYIEEKKIDSYTYHSWGGEFKILSGRRMLTINQQDDDKELCEKLDIVGKLRRHDGKMPWE